MAEFLNAEAVRALAWALVHFLWQGVLLAALAAVALRLTNRPSRRYALGVAVLVAMVAAPVATFLLYLGQVSSMVDQASLAVPPVSGAAAGDANRVAPAFHVDMVWWPAASVIVWLSGIAVLSLRLAGGWLVARRMTARAVRPAHTALQALATELAARLAVDRAVRVLESSAVAVPVVVGWLRPAIVFPVAALSGLSTAQIEALLAHELAHVRRHDYLVNLLQSCAEVVLFYHPAVWWLSGQIRRERERCCDDIAIGMCDRLVYATALTDLATMVSPRVALAATGGDLVDRVRRILEREESFMSASQRWGSVAVLVVLLGAAVPVLLAAVRPELPPSSVAVAQPGADEATASREQSAIRFKAGPGGSVELQSGDLVIRASEILLQKERELSELFDALDVLTATSEAGIALQTTDQARRAEQERALRIELEAATRDYERIRKLVEVGLATPSELRELEKKLALLNAGGDSEKEHVIEVEAALKDLHDARRRFEAGLLSSRQLAEVELAAARLQAREPVERNLIEFEAARQNLEATKVLVEKGLLAQSALRDAELKLSEMEQKAKRLDQEKVKAIDIERKKMVELVDKVEKIQKQDSLRIAEEQKRMKDLILQYDKAKADYQKRLADIEVKKDVQQKLETLKGRLVDVQSNRPIEAGDFLMITIAGETELPTIYRIAGDGTIRVPLLGSFKVLGETPDRVREAIGRKLSETRLGSASGVTVRLRRPESPR